MSSETNEADDPLIGEVIADRFRVTQILGEGGAGRVYEALQVGLGRRVAVKVLHPHVAAVEEMTQRFHREARAASMLEHPNSVVVYDFGTWRGQLYIVMEFLDGPTLADHIDAHGAMATEEVLTVALQLLGALEAAHAIGLIHRDLKPENVVLLHDHEGGVRVKVVDFGLARPVDPGSDMRLTRDNSVSGTPTHMSPEQARGDELDGRSDLYSVGVILYEMLCGELPFTGDRPIEVMLAHMYAEPDPPSRQAPAGVVVNPGLEAIALRCLSKDAGLRYASAVALKEALLGLGAGGGAEGGQPRASLRELPRRERVEAAGMPAAPAPTATPANAPFSALVVQSSAVSFASSSLARLRNHGCAVRQVAAVGEVATEPGEDVVIVDLRPDSAPVLAALADGFAARLGGVPFVLVGPDASFDAIAQALEVGAADYVTESTLERLVRVATRAIRRAKRRTKRGPVA